MASASQQISPPRQLNANNSYNDGFRTNNRTVSSTVTELIVRKKRDGLKSQEVYYPSADKRRNLPPAPWVDPCLSYHDPTTKLLCSSCNSTSGHQLFIRSATRVMCAYVNTTGGPSNIDSSSGQYICSLRTADVNTTDDKKLVTALSTIQSTLGYVLYYTNTNSYYKNYCLNSNVFYLREKTYLCTQPTSQYSICSTNTSAEDYTSRYLNAIYSSLNIKCYECYTKEMLMSNQYLTLLTDFGLYAATCVPQNADGCSLPSTNNNNPPCILNQFAQTGSGKCTDCNEKFTGCASCTESKCSMCIQNYYWMDHSTYQYKYQQPEKQPGRESKCTFDTCDVGYCQNTDLKTCEIQLGTTAHCLKCNSSSGKQDCQICANGYYLNAGKCTAFSDTTLTLSLFVKSTNSLYTYVAPTPPGQSTTTTTTSSCTTTAPTISAIDATVWSKASPFLQYALRQLYLKERQAKKIVAKIYLTKGIHFFFSCSGSESDFDTKKEFENAYKYCTSWDLYRYHVTENDNFEISILPLECKLGTSLGLAADPDFLALCVDFSKGDAKPTVHVNNAYTYFNITGKLTVQNIKFTGINALVQATSQSGKTVDFSVYPQLFCQQLYEQTGHVRAFTPTTLSTCWNTTIGVDYKCQDPLSDYLYAPPTAIGADNCGEQFNKTQFSTLTCSGEPYHSDFFTLSSDGRNIYAWRRKTLFNMYGFPEHRTNRGNGASPELVINGCEFEYFLAQGYESLINIETNSLAENKVAEKIVLESDALNSETQTFYTYNSGDRAAKINISDSTFKHSRFCKGMIVYRPAFYDASSTSLLNQTNLYMTTKLKDNSNAYIILDNSTFFNLNAYSTVYSLALTGMATLTTTLSGGSLQDDVTYPMFVHKGIIMNIEDFEGSIEIVGCTFEKNIHYIPSILYTGDSQSSLSLDMFTDSYTTKELQLKICDISTKKYAYFFGGSTVMSQVAETDLDEYFDSYERLGLIYVSRNKGQMIIKDNTFTNNIGTFGGAITINSPDWKEGKIPHVVIKDNLFQGNMAYFSGNAIYIRNTLYTDEKWFNENATCGGVNIISNTFLNNIGMKVHNGGAISSYCYYIDYIYHQDIGATSSYEYYKPQVGSSVAPNDDTIYVKSKTDGTEILIRKLEFNIQSNFFTDNFSGGKGTAVYVRQMSKVRIYQNSFVGNQPTLSIAEQLYSPYTKYLSGRSMTFYDADCVDELQFIEQCYFNNDVSNFGGVQWPKVQGAVHIIFCESDDCLNQQLIQELVIEESSFSKNLAGPILDDSSVDTASQIFIRGGMNVSIGGCTFQNNRGSLYTFSNSDISKILKYFPSDYVDYSHSPVINILMTPPTKVKFDVAMNFTIYSSKFYNNRNIQVLGLSSNTMYQGSLIQMANLASSEPSNDQNLTLTIMDCDFKDNIFTGAESSLISSKKILTKVAASTFINNGRISEDSVEQKRSDSTEFLYNSSVEFDFNSYEFDDSQQYGCICLDGDTQLAQPHQIINNTFKFNFASQGTAVTLLSMNNQEVYLSGNSYQYLFAYEEGAILYWEQNSKRATVFFEKEQAKYIFSQNNGAIRIKPLKKQLANLIITNSSFDNMNSNYGGAISLFEVGKVLVKQSNFTRNPSPTSNLTNLTLQAFVPNELELLGNFINSTLLTKMVDTLIRYRGLIDMQFVDNAVSTQNLTFNDSFIQSTSDSHFRYSEFINCNIISNDAQLYAGIYTYQSYIRVANILSTAIKRTVTTTTVKNASTGEWWQTKPKNVTTTTVVTEYIPMGYNPYFLANNTFKAQGVLGFEGSTQFILENVQFYNNTAQTKAASLYFTSSSGNVLNSSFINNTAKSSGMIIIEGNCFVDFQNCLFEGNWARDSAALFAQNNPDSWITFTNSNFTNNRAGTNLINLLYSNANITNSTFVDNIADSVNHGITLINSQANLLQVFINYKDTNFTKYNAYTVDTGFFNLNYQSSITLSNSTIMNTRGAMAAVLYVTGQSSALLINNTLIKNCYSKEGDAVLANLAKQLIVDQVTFSGNGQTDLKVQQTPTKVWNSSFSYSPKSSVYVTSSTIELINNTFFDGYYEYIPENGNALYCDCQGEILIENNSFSELSAIKGGAMFLGTSTRTEDQKFIVKGNIFALNSAQQGGAIYLQDAVKLELIDNIFESNFAIKIEGSNVASKLSAKGLAGAFYYTCEIDGVSLLPSDAPDYQKSCVVELQGVNRFTNNSAHDGGAILWTKDRPIIAEETIYSENSAFYGTDIASYPGGLKMVFISNNDYVNKYNNSGTSLRLLQTQDNSTASEDQEIEQNVPTLVSGNTIDFNLIIIDQDGNVYNTDSSSKAVLDKENAKVNDTILLNNEVIAKNGVYQFRDVKVISKPGSNASLKLSITGLESFGNDIAFLDNPIQFNATVRSCVAGEEYTDDGKCVVCPEGTFQYSVPEGKTACQTCPPNANCYGKATVAPLYGYWRSSNTSSNFIKCPNFDMCLGGSEEYPLGECRTGYQGIVCGDCQQNYSKTKQFTCGMCPDRTRNMIQTIFILVAYVGYVSFLVRSTLASADKQKPVHSVYLKILTNHFQILGAISNIDYQWPAVIEKFQESQHTVSSASEQVFSFDCFLMGQNGTDEGIPVFFQKLMMFGMLPFIMFIVCLGFWAIVGRLQRKTLAEFRGKFISTLIVVLFLVHPDIAKSMFLTFNCLEVDGIFRMKENIKSVCYKDQHMFFISIVAFPSIGLWVFGIPLFALLVLVRNKRVLNLMIKKEITQSENEEITQLKTKYGFLFAGYNARTFFWEVIIMYRKILIIMTSVFLSTVSSESQVLVVIFIIVLNMFLQIRFTPYYTDTLNKMENYSLQVAAVTVYTGMFYVTGKHYNYMSNQAVSWFFLSCIVLPNVIFILYWVYNMRIEVVKMIYHTKLPECVFKTVAWCSRVTFYERHLKRMELFEKANEVKIVETGDIQGDFDKIGDGKQGNKFESLNSMQKEGMTEGAGAIGYPEKSSNTLDEFKMDQTEFTHRGEVKKKRKHRKQNYLYGEDDGPTNNGSTQQNEATTETKKHRKHQPSSMLKQWDMIPSTARSMKVHPESVINTARLNPTTYRDYAIDHNDIQVMDDPEYSTPGDDNLQIDKASFALDNSKMMERIKKNKKRDLEDEGRKSKKKSRRYQEEVQSPGREKSRSKSPKRREYNGEEIIELDDVEIGMQSNQFNSQVRLQEGVAVEKRHRKKSPQRSPQNEISSPRREDRQQTTFDPNKLKKVLSSSLGPDMETYYSPRRDQQFEEEGQYEDEITSEIGQLTQTIKFGNNNRLPQVEESPRQSPRTAREAHGEEREDKPKSKNREGKTERNEIISVGKYL